MTNNNLIIIKNKHTLKFDDFYFECSIGKKGITNKKIEGDNKTPKGLFKLGSIYYRPDRVKKLKSKIMFKKIKSNMGWCNDIKDKKNYNKLINLKKNFKGEKLYRKDYKYNYFIPILYNTKKRILGKGSAIFLHLTKNYKGTVGCVALKKKDFLILIKLINKNTKIKIY
tara:strand:- start:1904 stop:2410 length:507 start_codon:yes stop_codon:yes gene_type:complete